MGLHYISWLSEDSKDAAPEMFRSEVFYDAGVDASEMFNSETEMFQTKITRLEAPLTQAFP